MSFRFRGPLRRFVAFQREVEVEGVTVQDSLCALCRAYPALVPVLLDGDGALRSAHRLFLNGRQLTRAELATPTSRADQVDILTAIAGG